MLKELGFKKQALLDMGNFSQNAEELTDIGSKAISLGNKLDDVVFAISKDIEEDKKKKRNRKKVAGVQEIAPTMKITELTPDVLAQLSEASPEPPSPNLGEIYTKAYQQNQAILQRMKRVKEIGYPGQFNDFNSTKIQ